MKSVTCMLFFSLFLMSQSYAMQNNNQNRQQFQSVEQWYIPTQISRVQSTSADSTQSTTVNGQAQAHHVGLVAHFLQTRAHFPVRLFVNIALIHGEGRSSSPSSSPWPSVDSSRAQLLCVSVPPNNDNNLITRIAQ